jgi:hypothetical protein
MLYRNPDLFGELIHGESHDLFSSTFYNSIAVTKDNKALSFTFGYIFLNVVLIYFPRSPIKKKF